MLDSHGISNGYMRRLYLASARRALRSMLRALFGFAIAAGLVGAAVAALGMVA